MLVRFLVVGATTRNKLVRIVFTELVQAPGLNNFWMTVGPWILKMSHPSCTTGVEIWR